MSLVERAARGDRVAFDILAASRAPGPYNVARMVLRDDDLAAARSRTTLSSRAGCRVSLSISGLSSSFAITGVRTGARL
ncbi:MAG: hypothetical protein H0V73_11430 [Chloroflexi bacterium]|nr:hypothetical protein [Chloroflexota bacterium]